LAAHLTSRQCLACALGPGLMRLKWQARWDDTGGGIQPDKSADKQKNICERASKSGRQTCRSRSNAHLVFLQSPLSSRPSCRDGRFGFLTLFRTGVSQARIDSEIRRVNSPCELFSRPIPSKFQQEPHELPHFCSLRALSTPPERATDSSPSLQHWQPGQTGRPTLDFGLTTY
jgi:hypothetical protein